MKHLKYFETSSKDINYWLLIATMQNNLKDIEYSLNMGADINTIDDCVYNDGKTPLIISICNNNKRIVDYLIDRHADPNKRTYNGNTALIYTIGRDFDEDIIKKLIGIGADVNITGVDNTSPLIQAAIMSSYVALKILIDAGANWNLKNDLNRDFYSYLTAEEKEKIKNDYPEKYKEYIILKKAEEEYNL